MTEQPESEIPYSDAANRALAEADAQTATDQEYRKRLMKEIARQRWEFAKYHQMDNGGFLNFEKWSFQKDIYQCDAPEIVVVGSTGWGKSEFLIVDAIVRSAMGLQVFYVMNNSLKRDKFVASRVNPVIKSVPLYKKLVNVRKSRGADADSARFKFFGDGSINFIGSESARDFESYRAQCVITDEHQSCNQENLRKTFHRLNGNPERFLVLVGNPRGRGTAENQNLHWEFLSSDQRQWHVPCPHCQVPQVLGWESHFIKVHRNKFDAILHVEIRDEERADESKGLEFRPICGNCRRPMRRLAPDGFWKPMNPGHYRAGFQLSNLYNPESKVLDLMKLYRSALHDPGRMADFVNDELGEPYNVEGAGITDELLSSAATCQAAGIAPYRLMPAGAIQWRNLDAA
jgi:phage terminase large subunit GpA-like protein